MSEEANLATDVAAAINEAATEVEKQSGAGNFARTQMQRLRAVPSAAVNAVADFDRLLAIGQKLLTQRQEKVIAAEAEYQKDRTAILNNCRTQMERLKIATEEDLRRLEAEHEKDMLDHQRTITALRGLRG